MVISDDRDDKFQFLPPDLMALTSKTNKITGMNDFFSAVPGGEIGEPFSSYPEHKPPQLSVTLKKKQVIFK